MSLRCSDSVDEVSLAIDLVRGRIALNWSRVRWHDKLYTYRYLKDMSRPVTSPFRLDHLFTHDLDTAELGKLRSIVIASAPLAGYCSSSARRRAPCHLGTWHRLQLTVFRPKYG